MGLGKAVLSEEAILLALYNAYAGLLFSGLNLDLVVKSQNWDFHTELLVSSHSSSTNSPTEICCLVLASVEALHAQEQSSTWVCSKARRSVQGFPKDAHCHGSTKVKGVALPY